MALNHLLRGYENIEFQTTDNADAYGVLKSKSNGLRLFVFKRGNRCHIVTHLPDISQHAFKLSKSTDSDQPASAAKSDKAGS